MSVTTIGARRRRAKPEPQPQPQPEPEPTAAIEPASEPEPEWREDDILDWLAGAELAREVARRELKAAQEAAREAYRETLRRELVQEAIVAEIARESGGRTRADRALFDARLRDATHALDQARQWQATVFAGRRERAEAWRDADLKVKRLLREQADPDRYPLFDADAGPEDDDDEDDAPASAPWERE